MDNESRKPWWVLTASTLLVILVPFVLVLTSVRLLLTPAFIRIEYRLPGFPQDPFGLTLEDRLEWAPITLDYLLNNEGIAFLGDLRFEEGEAVFNERELGHMEDVKQLTQIALRVWWASGAGAIFILGGLWFSGERFAAWRSLKRGGLATLIVMIVLGLGLAVGFSLVFVGFHRVFFEGETWLFPRSDTLIRLFPERFWQDAFIFIVLLTAVPAGGLYAIARRKLGRWQTSVSAQGEG